MPFTNSCFPFQFFSSRGSPAAASVANGSPDPSGPQPACISRDNSSGLSVPRHRRSLAFDMSFSNFEMSEIGRTIVPGSRSLPHVRSRDVDSPLAGAVGSAQVSLPVERRSRDDTVGEELDVYESGQRRWAQEEEAREEEDEDEAPSEISERSEPSEINNYLMRPPRLVRAVSGSNVVEGSKFFCAVIQDLDSSSSTALACCSPLSPGHMDCAICMEVFRLGDSVQPMVGCGHLFHEHCVRAHIRARRQCSSSIATFDAVVSCPLCRGPIFAMCEEEMPEAERERAVFLSADSPSASDSPWRFPSTSTVHYSPMAGARMAWS